MARENTYEALTSEAKTKLKGCETPEEVLALAKEEGYELSDDELERISGGDGWDDLYDKCPKCGSTNVSIIGQHVLSCKNCEYYGSY